MRRLIAVLFALAVAAFMVGCGGGDDETPPKGAAVKGAGTETAAPAPAADYSSPKATFNTMMAAGKAGAADAIMACFCKATRESLAAMRKEFADFKEMADRDMTKEVMKKARTGTFELGEAKIEGDKAKMDVTEVVEGEKKKPMPFDFVREDGNWLIHFALGTPEEIRQQAAQLRRIREAAQKLKQKGE